MDSVGVECVTRDRRRRLNPAMLFLGAPNQLRGVYERQIGSTKVIPKRTAKSK
jgi:hypothetical protein